MDVRGKLVDIVCDATQINGCIHSCNHPPCAMDRGIVDALIENGVTVQECKVAEIDQFKLPIDDAILILKEEHKQRADGYATHLSYGGKGDPAEEVHLDALEMAIAALEWQNRTLPQPPKGGMKNAADSCGCDDCIYQNAN